MQQRNFYNSDFMLLAAKIKVLITLLIMIKYLNYA